MAQNNRQRKGFFPSSSGSGGGGSTSIMSSGGGIFLMFLLIIIGGGFLLTGGIDPLPKDQLSEPPDGIYEIDEESLKELEDQRGNLQLKVIKFKECKGQVSATLFVDRSGSMKGIKLRSLKQALNGFIDQMGDESVTGLISYSNNVTEDVAIDFFSNNSSQMRSAINRLSDGGWTETRSAFTFTLDKTTEARDKFPDKEHVLVFLSDGIPETNIRTCSFPACSSRRCFETTEDPTNTSFGPNIAQQIKDAGIRIFSIALYDSSDTCFQDDLRSMMQRIASPDSYYETPNSQDLESIYREISTKICGSVKN